MKNFQQRDVTPSGKDLQVNPPSVEKYMTRNLITFTADTEINTALESLISNKISGAPVLNDKGEVVGLIDDKDCLKMLFAGAYYNHPVGKETVSDYMTNVMRSISVHNNILEVADIFLHSPFKRLLVMDDNDKLVGQISRRDILLAIKDMKTSTW